MRIILALIPATIEYCGGHKVDKMLETHITIFFEKLGAHGAPKPEWGIRDGWQSYVAHLLSWCSGVEISALEVGNFVDCRKGCSYTAQGASLLKQRSLVTNNLLAHR